MILSPSNRGSYPRSRIIARPTYRSCARAIEAGRGRERRTKDRIGPSTPLDSAQLQTGLQPSKRSGMGACSELAERFVPHLGSGRMGSSGILLIGKPNVVFSSKQRFRGITTTRVKARKVPFQMWLPGV